MTKTIVLIESDPSFAAVLSRDLEKAHLAVVETSDGKGAVELARGLKPDLIVLAVELSRGQNGYVLCSHLKKDDALKSVPLILMAADASGFDKHKSLRAHADAYLAKPFAPQALLEHIDALIGLPKLQAEPDFDPDTTRPFDLSAELDLDNLDAFADQTESMLDDVLGEAAPKPTGDPLPPPDAFDLSPLPDLPNLIDAPFPPGRLSRSEETAALPDELDFSIETAAMDASDKALDPGNAQASLEATILVEEKQAPAEATDAEGLREHADRLAAQVRDLEDALLGARNELEERRASEGSREHDYFELREQCAKRDLEILRLKQELYGQEQEALRLREREYELEKRQSALTQSQVSREAKLKALTQRVELDAAERKAIEQQLREACEAARLAQAAVLQEQQAARSETASLQARIDDLEADLEASAQREAAAKREVARTEAARGAIRKALQDALAQLDAQSRPFSPGAAETSELEALDLGDLDLGDFRGGQPTGG